MANWTLKDIVQDVLAGMGSDEVNSINDTVEASDVAKIVRRCYFNIVDIMTLPTQYEPFNLTASGDNTKPVLMTKPDAVKTIEWLKYDRQILADAGVARFEELTYVPLGDFLSRMHNLRTTDSFVESFSHTVTSGNTITFYYRNDVPPTEYTTIDDNTLIFDSFDEDVDTTLQSSKTVGFGEKNFTFTLSDSFVPPLSDAQHTLLLNEALSWAYVELKQTAHPKAERESIRGRIRQKTKGAVVNPYQTEFGNLPNYGRK